MSRYPVLTAELTAANALTLGCNSCLFQWQAADVDAFCIAVDSGSCPSCGSFDVVPAFDCVPACPACGKLGYDAQAVGGACSRRCQLQAEYAASLAAPSSQGSGASVPGKPGVEVPEP